MQWTRRLLLSQAAFLFRSIALSLRALIDPRADIFGERPVFRLDVQEREAWDLGCRGYVTPEPGPLWAAGPAGMPR
jgi:hypothetical protein